MRSPREAWVEQQIRERYNQADILDVGFVSAYNEPVLHKTIRKQNPRARIFGIDINQDGILKHHLPNTLVADAAALPFANASFDCVLFLEVMEHVYDPCSMLREIARVLRPNGGLIITTPNSWDYWRMIRYWLLGRLRTKADINVARKYLGNPDHLVFYDPLSLISICYNCGFQTQHILTKNYSIPFLSKYIRKLNLLDLQFYPMNRLGGYICLLCVRTEGLA